MDRDTKKKLSCPKCGNDELQFISVQKEKEKGEFLMACATFSILAIIGLIIAIMVVFPKWTNMPNEIASSDAINTATLVLLLFIALFALLLFFILCNGFQKITSYETKTEYICACCGNQEALEELIIKNKK